MHTLLLASEQIIFIIIGRRIRVTVQSFAGYLSEARSMVELLC